MLCWSCRASPYMWSGVSYVSIFNNFWRRAGTKHIPLELSLKHHCNVRAGKKVFLLFCPVSSVSLHLNGILATETPPYLAEVNVLKMSDSGKLFWNQNPFLLAILTTSRRPEFPRWNKRHLKKFSSFLCFWFTSVSTHQVSCSHMVM